MIQRVQSIYLLLVTALMATFLFIPFAHFDAENLRTFTLLGISTSDGEMLRIWGLFALGAITTVLSFIAIFLYKNRPIQMQLCKINTLCLLCLYLGIGLYIYLTKIAITLSPAIAIPAIALVFNTFAHRAIKRDEKLVRSLDRVR